MLAYRLWRSLILMNFARLCAHKCVCRHRKKTEHRTSSELMSFVNKVNTDRRRKENGILEHFREVIVASSMSKIFIRSVFRNIECHIYDGIVHCHVTL